MKRTTLILFILAVLRVHSQNYALDTSFGVNGVSKFTSDVRLPLNVFFENNKYIITLENRVTSINYDGTADTSFGTAGIFTLPAISGMTFAITNSKLNNGYLYLYGKITNTSSDATDIFIAKITTAGSYDTTFGTNGILQFDSGGNEICSDIFIAGNDSIFTISTKKTTNSSLIVVSKINPGGTVDLSFDPSGYKTYTELQNVTGNKIFEYDSGLLLVGLEKGYMTQQNILLLKINQDGSLVSSYGVNGVKKIPMGGPGTAFYTILDASLSGGNKLYLTYLFSASFTSQYNYLLRYNLNTDLQESDESVPYMGPFFRVQNDSKVIIAGGPRCNIGPCIRNFELWKRNPDGSYDMTFSQAGIYTYNFPALAYSDDISSAFYQHSDGKILMAGVSTGNNFPNSWSGLALIRITESELGIDNPQSNGNGFYLYPNPSHDQVNIKTHGNLAIEQIVVTDLLGKVITTQKGNIPSVNIASLENGIYIFKIVTAGHEQYLKFIKN